VTITLTGGIWKFALKRDNSGMAESIWKSLFSREDLPAFQGLQAILLRLAQGETFSVTVIGVELNLFRFPDDAFHVSRFLGQATGILKLDAVNQVFAVLGQGWFIRIIKPNIPVVLLDLSLNGTPCSFSVDHTILAGDAVNG